MKLQVWHPVSWRCLALPIIPKAHFYYLVPFGSSSSGSTPLLSHIWWLTNLITLLENLMTKILKEIDKPCLLLLTNDSRYQTFSPNTTWCLQNVTASPLIAPFIHIRHGPACFKREFPMHDASYQVESNEIWKAFLTPKLLLTRISSTKIK